MGKVRIKVSEHFAQDGKESNTVMTVFLTCPKLQKRLRFFVGYQASAINHLKAK